MKGFDKVTFIIETTGNSDFFDCNIFGGQHLAGTFDSVIIKVIDRRSFCNASKIAAEILGVHTGNLGKSFQRNVIVVILGDIEKHIFHGSKSFERDVFKFVVFVKMFIDDDTQ